MRSRTSFFNGTAVRKNLTRFAPVWIGYAICLVVGLAIEYMDTNATFRDYWFGYRLMQTVCVTAVVNLVYGPLVAQLLFGDLYTGRMCNMMHAFPLRREGWFLSNVVSGLLFSLIPTAVMTVVAWALLVGSVFENAMMIALYLFLGANLQFICFFGMAVFAAHCTGNRFTMVAGYGLLTFGAYLAYFLVDTVYTPMLRGVITPSDWAMNLTPLVQMVNKSILQEVESLNDLTGVSRPDVLDNVVAHYTVDQEAMGWHWIYAAAGLVFAVLGLALYRRRHLERAGDAVAFPWLEPVFNVLCAMFVSVGSYLGLYAILGLRDVEYILWVGLIFGWIIGRMLIERSARVFKLKNFVGLAALCAVFGASLFLTQIDILGIEKRIPDREDIAKYRYQYGLTREIPEEDQEKLLRLHGLCIEQALDPNAYGSGNTYIRNEAGEWVSRYPYLNEHWPTDPKTGEYIGQPPEYRYTDTIYITYELKNGSTFQRRYIIWADSEMGGITREMSSRWENVRASGGSVYENGVQVDIFDKVMNNFDTMYIDSSRSATPYEIEDKATALSFIEAVKRDCAEGNMAPSHVYHTGYFIRQDFYTKEEYTDRSIYVNIDGGTRDRSYNWSVTVYPDARHTIAWLKERDLLDGELVEGVQRPLW